MVTQSRQTSALYDSRKVPRKRGIGYPSCNTELAVLPPNTSDPHGYYREIGVSPGATHRQIRMAVRSLLRQLHPDHGGTDTERFQRVRLIADVLLDPIARDKYNRTPKGQRLVDAVYLSELSKLPDVDMEAMFGTAPAKPRNSNPYAKDRIAGRYDYFAMGHLNDPWQADELKAQLWYHFLIEVAPLVNYRRVIKVMIHDGEPEYSHTTMLMKIPRSWNPSSALAMSLFTAVAGFRPGRNDLETRSTGQVSTKV